jgi:hypothetical protein
MAVSDTTGVFRRIRRHMSNHLFLLPDAPDERTIRVGASIDN